MVQGMHVVRDGGAAGFSQALTSLTIRACLQTGGREGAIGQPKDECAQIAERVTAFQAQPEFWPGLAPAIRGVGGLCPGEDRKKGLGF
jgi:hypothetical protein